MANMLRAFLAGSLPLLSILLTGHGGRDICPVPQEPPSLWDCKAQYQISGPSLDHNIFRRDGNTMVTRTASSFACVWSLVAFCLHCTLGGSREGWNRKFCV